MVEDIIRHRLATGDEILSADDEKRIRYNAVSRGVVSKSWSMRLPAFRESRKPTGIFAGLDRAGINNLMKGADPQKDLNLDLEIMNRDQLLTEAKKLRAGIRQHRDAKGHELCWYVPELWGLLPERLEPKPEVPPRGEFLHHCAVYRDSLGVEPIPKYELTEEEKREIGRQVHEDFLAAVEKVRSIGARLDEASRRRAREVVLKSF